MHLSQTTRPDLAFLVSRLGQYMTDPRLGHWRAAKRALRYLRGTMHLGLEYGSDVEEHKASYGGAGLVGYADSDYAGDSETRRSTMGYVYCLNGAAASWSSKRARTIAVSSTKAEYVALSNASKQAVWMKRLINDLQVIDRIDMLPMLGDNTSSIKMTKNDEFHGRTKHIDIQHHFIREPMEKNEISIDYINTKDMLADDFTKALGRPEFHNHRRRIGMVPAGKEDGEKEI